MDIYSFNINDNPYEVKILSIKKNIARVEVNAVEYEVDISDMGDLHFESSIQKTGQPVRKMEREEVVINTTQTSAPQVSAGTNDIAAPMPGLICKIHVAEGDKVKTGDVILTIEAMKMENQVKTTRDGVISKINVKEGDTVAEGAPLVTLGG